MKLKNIATNLFMIVLLLCSHTLLAAKAKNNVVANSSQENKEVAVYTEEKLNILLTAKHPEFTLKLKSNPTTGYSWFLREYDNSLIQPVKQSFQKSDTTLAGAPGVEVWTFRVKKEGFIVPQQTLLRMIYARPWQGSDSASQLVFRITTAGARVE